VAPDSPDSADPPPDELDDGRPWDAPPRYMPSLQEIAVTTAEIRAGWTDEERAARYVGPQHKHWRPPGVDRYADVVPADSIKVIMGTGSVQPLGDVWGHDDHGPKRGPRVEVDTATAPRHDGRPTNRVTRLRSQRS
jgi:hypothetical protein